MRHASILCLGLLLILAGCAAGPFGGQEGPVTVTVNNSANLTQTHTFEVWVVKYPGNVTVREENGYEYTDDINPGLSTREPGDYHTVTAIEFPDSARLHGRYRLESSEMNHIQIRKYPSSFAVYVVIYHNDHVVSRVSAHCDGDLVSLDVTMFHYGSGSAYNCQGGLF
jgi:hypothetical protein